MQPVKAPWIRPGVVIHDGTTPVDGLLADFAGSLRARGFAVAGLVQQDNSEGEGFGGRDGTPVKLVDLGSGDIVPVGRDTPDAEVLAIASRCLRGAMRDDVDLVVIGSFAAFKHAARELKAALEHGLSPGLPVLTSISGQRLYQWHGFIGQDGAMLAPSLDALWRWWGPDRLYRDLALGVADHEVRRLVCGRRWLMVEGPGGAGLAYLPKNPASLHATMPKLRCRSLRQLAQLCQSWDPLEMAVGVAAINAHYNRFDLHGVSGGDGAATFRRESGRVVVIGGFPGQQELLPRAQVIDSDPKPGEYPIVAIDTLVPGCAAAVVTSSTLINRNLPRILRLSHGARVALIGPATPLTPRLHDYGIEVLGGLVVRDARGLASAIEEGAGPREFSLYGYYGHLRRGVGGGAGQGSQGLIRGAHLASGEPRQHPRFAALAVG